VRTRTMAEILRSKRNSYFYGMQLLAFCTHLLDCQFKTKQKGKMKKILFCFTLISTTFVGKGQNLVPNGDFEQFSACPVSEAQIDLAAPWTNPVVWTAGGLQADYDNQCTNTAFIDVPNNNFGYQPAHSGVGYSGIFLYSLQWADLREYIQTTLTSPLVAGSCYHFEMYAALGDRCMFTTDDLEVYFSDTLMNGITNYFPLPVTPQIGNPGNFPDTSGWTLISGNYIAAGGETYMIIGNFKDDNNTTFMNVNNAGTDESYVYIDDVLLSICTGIPEQNSGMQAMIIFPNPILEKFTITFPNSISSGTINIRNVLGEKMMEENIINTSQKEIRLNNISPGIYFVNVFDGENHYSRKIIVWRN